MAYNVYCLCDVCGDTIINFTNRTVSVSKMRQIAKDQGWIATPSKGWICPFCKETLKHSNEDRKDNDDEA